MVSRYNPVIISRSKWNVVFGAVCLCLLTVSNFTKAAPIPIDVEVGSITEEALSSNETNVTKEEVLSGQETFWPFPPFGPFGGPPPWLGPAPWWPPFPPFGPPFGPPPPFWG